MTPNPLRAETERWFLSRGAPRLIDDYASDERVWTRARPFLVALLLAQTVWAFGDAYDGFRQGFVLAGVVVGLGVAVAVFQRTRGRHLFDVPNEVGVPELAFFVFATPLLALVISDESWALFGLSVGANVVILVLAWVIVAFGLIPMSRWAFQILLTHIRALTRLVARTLPMLLVLTVFMFINAEIWQVAHLVPRPTFLVINAILIVVGLTFVWLSTGGQLAELDEVESWQEACELAVDSPLKDLPEPNERLRGSSLDGPARLNLRLVMLSSLGVQVTLVAGLVAAFYVAVGLLLVTPDVLVAWAGEDSYEVLGSWQAGSLDLVLTAEHLRVAGLVGTLAGLNVAVVALTDEVYRETFAADLLEEIRENLAVRRLYRTLPKTIETDEASALS